MALEFKLTKGETVNTYDVGTGNSGATFFEHTYEQGYARMINFTPTGERGFEHCALEMFRYKIEDLRIAATMASTVEQFFALLGFDWRLAKNSLEG